MARKAKKDSDYRGDLFFALDRMKHHAREEGYRLGCRASDPEKHDNEQVRGEETHHRKVSSQWHTRAVKAFNNALSTKMKRASKAVTP